MSLNHMNRNLKAVMDGNTTYTGIIRRQDLWETCHPVTEGPRPLLARGIDPVAVARMDLCRIASVQAAEALTIGEQPEFRHLQYGDLLFRTADGMGFHRGWRRVGWDYEEPAGWSKVRSACSYHGKPSPVAGKVLWNGKRAYDRLDGEPRPVLFCEGEADWLSLCCAVEDLEWPVIGLASGSWNEELALCLIHKDSPIYLLMDEDKGGDYYRRVVCNTLPRHSFRTLRVPDSWRSRANGLLGKPEESRVDLNDLLRAGGLNPVHFDRITTPFTPPSEWKDYDARPEWLRTAPTKQKRHPRERTQEQIEKHFQQYADEVLAGLDGNRHEALRIFNHLYGMVERREIPESRVDQLAWDHYIKQADRRERRASRQELVQSCKKGLGRR